MASAITNPQAEPPIKLTVVASQPGFSGCRPIDMERPARRRDVCRVVIQPLLACKNLSVHKVFFSDTICTF